jgi:outer membrane protein assembly factor BamB
VTGPEDDRTIPIELDDDGATDERAAAGDPGPDDADPDESPPDGSDEAAPDAQERRSTRRRDALIATTAVLLVAVAIVAWLLWPRAQAIPQPAPSVLRPSYEVVRIIEGPGTGDLPRFDRPLGGAFADDGGILVTDSRNGRVCVFDADGRFVREMGRAGDTGTPRAAVLGMPVGLDVDASGTVYVADLRVGAVRAFDASGTFLRDIAPRDESDRADWSPTDVAVSSLGVFVSDATGVERFRRDGRPMGRLAATPAVSFDHPNGVAVATDGTVYVSDTNRARVVAVGADGRLRWITEGARLAGDRFGLPRGLAAAPGGGAYVADAFGFDVVRVSAEGTLTARFGRRGTDPGAFQFPNDVDVRGDLVLVTDKENNRVQVLRLLR